MRRHRKLKILKMLIRPHPELDYLPAAGRQACTADTRPIRLCGPRAGAPGMAPTLRNSIRLGVRLPSGKSCRHGAHEAVAASQRFTVPAVLTMSGAAYLW